MPRDGGDRYQGSADSGPWPDEAGQRDIICSQRQQTGRRDASVWATANSTDSVWVSDTAGRGWGNPSTRGKHGTEAAGEGRNIWDENLGPHRAKKGLRGWDADEFYSNCGVSCEWRGGRRDGTRRGKAGDRCDACLDQGPGARDKALTHAQTAETGQGRGSRSSRPLVIYNKLDNKTKSKHVLYPADGKRPGDKLKPHTWSRYAR